MPAAQPATSIAPHSIPSANDVARSAPLPVVLSAGPYYVGTTVTATIVVPGAISRPAIDLGPIRDFEAVLFDSGPLPDSTGTNGMVLRLNLLPKKPGALRLPPLTVMGPVGRQVTVPASITVEEPEPASDMSLTATLSEQKCYVGQPVTLEIGWTFAGRIGGIYAVDLRVPILDNQDFKHRDFFSVPKDFGAPIGMPVGNTRVIGGAFGRTIRMRKIIVPQKAGTFKIPPAALLCSVLRNATDSRMGFAYAPQYDNQFFADADKASAERLYVRSDPIRLEVLPLPAAGKPAGFSGIVGAFALQAGIEPATVREGEPLTMTLRAGGHPYVEVLDLPAFRELPGFRGRFRIPAERAVPTLQETNHGLEKTFRQSFRPVSTGVDKVPAIAISYFDPATATYGVATTPAMPIAVLPHSVANGFDAVLSDGSRLQNLLVPRPLAMGPNFAVAELSQHPPKSWIQTPGAWWVALVLPPLNFALILRATRRRRWRRRDPKLARAWWAYSDFKRATRRTNDPSVLDHALRQYLSDRLGIGVVTFGTIEPALRERGVRPEVIAILRDFLGERDRCDFSVGTGGSLPAANGERVPAAVGSIESSFNETSGRFPFGQVLRSTTVLALFCIAGPLLRSAPASAALTEADALFRTGINQRFEDPDAAKDAFKKAAASYEYVLRGAAQGLERGKLHYNSGAARFFAGDLGAAVYHLRMAAHYLPADERIHAALGYVRTQQPDAPASSALRGTSRWFSSWRFAPDPARTELSFFMAWALFWAAVTVAAFRPSARLRRITIALLVGLAVIGTLLSIGALGLDLKREGVVIAGEIVARKGPAAIYEPAFESALHAGAEFRIVTTANEWFEIRLPGIKDPCWIPTSAARLLASGETALF